MSELLMQIEQRAATMPWMTAVRLGGQIVTYGDLHQRIAEYDVVVARHAMSQNAALTAALVSFLPESLRSLEPLKQAAWIADAITWLSRSLADSHDPLTAAV